MATGIESLGALNLNPSSVSAKTDTNAGGGFADVLKKSIDNLNETQKVAETSMQDMASGNVKNLHQAAIAIDKAEVEMKLMLEIRNKAISAYKEILRTQV